MGGAGTNDCGGATLAPGSQGRPLFARFCIYAYRKFVRYEEAPPELRKSGVVTEIPAGLLPERPKPTQQPTDDPALREYNAYLAELAKNDAEKQNRTTA